MGSGFKDWSPGDVLTAADVDGYLMRQTVMTFADASARDTALSGVLDEGMVAYLEDTNVTTYYNGSSWEDIRGLGGGSATSLGNFSAGDVLDAADLNAIGTWTSYTPTWTNFTVGNATVDFKYSVVNKIVFVEGLLTLGSTSAMGATPYFSLPVSRSNSDLSQIGVGTLVDVGTATFMAFPLNVGANDRCYLYALNAAAAGGLSELSVTSTSPFTWTTGDLVQVSLRYQAA